MNDAFRGMVTLAAATALLVSLDIAVSYLSRWRGDKENRKHIRWHAWWMNLSLLITTVLIVGTSMGDSGSNAPLSWKDPMRGAFTLSALAGLLPVWHTRRRAVDSRAERRTGPPEAKGPPS